MKPSITTTTSMTTTKKYTLLLVLLFALAVQINHTFAATNNFQLNYQCGPAYNNKVCDRATPIFGALTLNDTYTTNAPMTLKGMFSSDDNAPTTEINSGARTPIDLIWYDLFRGTYSDLTGGISNSISFGNAPGTSGTYSIMTRAGGLGYSSYQNSLNITVTGTPSVQLNFQ